MAAPMPKVVVVGDTASCVVPPVWTLTLPAVVVPVPDVKLSAPPVDVVPVAFCAPIVVVAPVAELTAVAVCWSEGAVVVASQARADGVIGSGELPLMLTTVQAAVVPVTSPPHGSPKNRTALSHII